MDKLTFIDEKLSNLRSKDNYACEERKSETIELFFPNSEEALVNDLSNVTSAFYGFLLKGVADQFGADKINKISKDLFYELGKFKTHEVLAKKADLPMDTRAFFYVLASAIFNASPEFIFSIEEFSPSYSKVRITGIDRYHRITKALGLEQHLEFPTLIPFAKAINDVLQLNAEITVTQNSLSPESITDCVYEFKLDL